MDRLLQIGVQVERSRAHGRTLLEGLAEFARAQYDWRLTLLEPAQLTDPAVCARFDGFIVRVMDDATARALMPMRRRVVDVYGRLVRSPFTTLRLDDAAIAQMAAAFYADRLMEAVWKIEVEDFPAFILVDDKGNDFFKTLKPWTPCAK